MEKEVNNRKVGKLKTNFKREKPIKEGGGKKTKDQQQNEQQKLIEALTIGKAYSWSLIFASHSSISLLGRGFSIIPSNSGFFLSSIFHCFFPFFFVFLQNRDRVEQNFLLF